MAAEDTDRDDDSTDEGAVETSLEEFLQRRERGSKTRTEDPDDEEALLEAIDEREGRGAESLTVKVVPEQPDEFTCRRCFLVKHRTQLKDRRRMLCADCA
jgi:hypothetical protein